MQTFWLVRHAHRLDFIEPEWFESAIYPYDPPLSFQGVEQAVALAGKFANIPIDRIFTSPFLRTIQTVDPLARLLQLPIRLEWGLCEWLCQDWTTELPKTTPIAELIEYYPNIDDGYQSLVMPCYPETIAALDIRLNSIARKLIQNQEDRILAIAHKGSVLGIASALTGDNDWQNYDLPCGGIIKLVGDGEIWSGIIEG